MKFSSKLYLFLLIFCPLIPRSGGADIVAIQWVALSIITIFGLILVSKKKIDNQIKFNLLNTPLYIFSAYLVVAFISIFFAINKVESYISISKIFLVFANLYILHTMLSYVNLKFAREFSISLVVLFLVIETLYSLLPMVYYTDFTNFQFAYASEFMKGLGGNKNITAASIMIKIPFLIYFFKNQKIKILKFSSIIMIGVSSLTVLYLGSRAAYISLFILIFLLLIWIIIKLAKKSSFQFYRPELLSLVFIISALIFYSSTIPSKDKGSVQNRMEFVSNPSSLDNSAKQRLRYYGQAINYFTQNPLMGVGIGNWKIISIKLDKENIVSYIMPYNLHNDFLEVLGETGIFGFIFYASFFASMFLILFLLARNQKTNGDKILPFLFFSLIFYCVDASLAFPQFRVINQISLIVLCFIVVNTLKLSKLDDYEN
jgi:O-antigen ligase